MPPTGNVVFVSYRILDVDISLWIIKVSMNLSIFNNALLKINIQRTNYHNAHGKP